MPARQGQVYIGVIIALGIFMILSQAVIALIISSYDLISYNRARTTAKHLATEQIELIRNLEFSDVGTVGGIPSGVLSQSQSINRNSQNYTTRISVVYVDDPFDDLAPTDLLPNDYKRVRVDVSWGGLTPSEGNTITLVTDIAPEGIETIAGGGTISVLVFNANAEPVPQATVHLEAPSLDPPIDLTLMTNNSGRVILPGAPICTDCYQITVTKENYSSERTYSTAEIPNPNKPNITVLEGGLTETSFSIDIVSTLAIHAVSDRINGFTPLPGQSLVIQGTKTLGTNELDEPIYKFEEVEAIADGSGIINLENIEWDNYQVSLPDPSTRVISSSNPLIPIQLSPATTLDAYIALGSKTNHSLSVLFTDVSESPIASVSALLADNTSYEASTSSGPDTDPDFGFVYYPSLDEITYTLHATASGYESHSSDINISGNNTETVILTLE